MNHPMIATIVNCAILTISSKVFAKFVQGILSKIALIQHFMNIEEPENVESFVPAKIFLILEVWNIFFTKIPPIPEISQIIGGSTLDCECWFWVESH